MLKKRQSDSPASASQEEGELFFFSLVPFFLCQESRPNRYLLGAVGGDNLHFPARVKAP